MKGVEQVTALVNEGDGKEAKDRMSAVLGVLGVL
jgi:hypothetical protein